MRLVKRIEELLGQYLGLVQIYAIHGQLFGILQEHHISLSRTHGSRGEPRTKLLHTHERMPVDNVSSVHGKWAAWVVQKRQRVAHEDIYQMQNQCGINRISDCRYRNNNPLQAVRANGGADTKGRSITFISRPCWQADWPTMSTVKILDIRQMNQPGPLAHCYLRGDCARRQRIRKK